MKRVVSLMVMMSLLFPGLTQGKAENGIDLMADQCFRTYRNTSVGGKENRAAIPLDTRR